MGWYKRDSLPLGIKGFTESGKVCTWINLCSLRFVEQLTLLQLRSDKRTQFCNVQNIHIKTYHVSTTATTEVVLYFQNGIQGNQKIVSHFQYYISWASHCGNPVVPKAAGHHVKFYAFIQTSNTSTRGKCGIILCKYYGPSWPDSFHWRNCDKNCKTERV
jgi:hypothetical protein